MGIFGTSEEIQREASVNVGSRLQADNAWEKSMNWFMGVDEYGRKRSGTQRAVVSGLKILAAAGVTAATGGAGAPLLVAALAGGATAAGLSYGAGQSVKSRARTAAGGGQTVGDVSQRQKSDYINAALYTATAGIGGLYKQGLQSSADAATQSARTQLAQQSVTIQPTNNVTAIMPQGGVSPILDPSAGTNNITSALAQSPSPVPSASTTWKAGLQETAKGSKVTWLDAAKQIPKDFAKFETKMEGKLGKWGYKIAKEAAKKGINKGIETIKEEKQEVAPAKMKTTYKVNEREMENMEDLGLSDKDKALIQAYAAAEGDERTRGQIKTRMSSQAIRYLKDIK